MTWVRVSKNLARSLAALAQGADGQSKDDGEEQHLQQIARAHGFHGILGHNIEQGGHHIGRRHRLCFEPFGGQIETCAGVEDVGEDQPQGHSHGRGRQIVDDGFAGDAPEPGGVAHAGSASHKRNRHQGNHKHPNQTDKERAERFKPRIVKTWNVLPDKADDDTGGQAYTHLRWQAHLFSG